MKKFKVEFLRSNNTTRLLGYCADTHGEKEVDGEASPNLKNSNKIITNYLKNFPNFKSYYRRINGPHITESGLNKWNIDVGSWSEFFIITELNEEVNDDYYVEIFEPRN